ncbi:hypothetical protein GCM10008986_16610 [Salinibacillus aidingensis]|uniref:Uncharacterized protein n=1 Tax=Salinibacillus aidingensis TaxID=237684 RepID=A0ABP3L336_9BACI
MGALLFVIVAGRENIFIPYEHQGKTKLKVNKGALIGHIIMYFVVFGGVYFYLF